MLTSVSSLLVLPLLSYRLGVPDFVLGILAALSFMIATVGTAFSRTGTYYIIGQEGGTVRSKMIFSVQPAVLVCWARRSPPSSDPSCLKP